jgi:cbb3-type cytochrome oxidase subunit 3
MEPAAPPGPDPITALALEKLNDIVVPQPVSWMPQTWGWLALALLLVALVAFALWRRHRRYVANRYRREALAEIDRLTTTQGVGATTGIAEVLKRVALKAWPRETTASLSGAAWLAFLKQQGFSGDTAARVLDDLEYHADDDSGEGEARQFAKEARSWIERFHVSA